MGIISRGNPPDRQRTGTTVIAAGTKLVGDLALTDSLHIDGRVEGTIQSEGEVSIGQQGSADGEIRAERVMVSGEFSGLIESERLEIVSSGKVSGELLVEQLVIESGAQFNGTSKVRSEQADHARAKAEQRDAADSSTSGSSKKPGDGEPGRKKTRIAEAETG